MQRGRQQLAGILKRHRAETERLYFTQEAGAEPTEPGQPSEADIETTESMTCETPDSQAEYQAWWPYWAPWGRRTRPQPSFQKPCRARSGRPRPGPWRQQQQKPATSGSARSGRYSASPPGRPITSFRRGVM